MGEPVTTVEAFGALPPEEQVLKMRSAIRQGLGGGSLTPENKAAVDYFLGYFDALDDDDKDKERSTEEKLQQLLRVFALADEEERHAELDPVANPEAAADNAAGVYAGAVGIPVGTQVGRGSDAVTAKRPPFDRPQDGAAPPAPPPGRVSVDPNGITGRALIPPGESGRYRILAVQVGTLDSNIGTQSAHVQMVVVGPDGQIVRTFDMASGGSRTASGYSGINSALPGLDDAGNTRTVNYDINWSDVRLNRTDAGFRFNDGSPGFSFSLENPSNIGDVGGAGRNFFRIHPNTGHSNRSQGCLTFRNDAEAREFRDFMLSLRGDAATRPDQVEVVSQQWLAAHRAELAGRASIDTVAALSASPGSAPAARGSSQTTPAPRVNA